MRKSLETALYINVEDLDRKPIRHPVPQLPLHVDVIPSFQLNPEQLPVLGRVLRPEILGHSRFSISTLNEIRVGSGEKSRLAREMGGSVLYALHDDIIERLDDVDEPRITISRRIYRPHVVYDGERGIDWKRDIPKSMTASGGKDDMYLRGGSRQVKFVTLAQNHPEGWRVEGIFDLQEPTTSHDFMES